MDIKQDLKRATVLRLQWLSNYFTNIKELRKCMKNGLSCLDMDQRLHAMSGTPAKGSPSLLAEGRVLNHTEKNYFSEPEKNGCHKSTFQNSVKQV